jgi:hypothetical protein
MHGNLALHITGNLLPCTLKRFVLNNNATADKATADRPAPQNPITVTFRAPQTHRKLTLL